MMLSKYQFEYESYASIEDLKPEDARLLKEARASTRQAYAPYSKFHVAAVARLANGEILAGTNQENASFPAGICAERVLLSLVSSLYPAVAVDTMAISYNSTQVESDHPISPCGICRQSLLEYEGRVGHPVRLILGGMNGMVYIIPAASMLLPLSFSGQDLGRV